MKMKKILLIIFGILLMINPAISDAEEKQNILSMEELTIKIMPEFAYHPNDASTEHPPLLIGYQGTMLNHSDQPQKGQIEIPLPMEEKNFRIGYVADYSSDLSKVYEIEYIMDKEKGTVSWTTSEEIQPNEVYKFVVEFYTDALAVDKDKKSLEYQFKSFADIGLFNVSFVEPQKAKNFHLNPAPEKNKTHADEEGVHSYNFQGLKAGEEKSFTLAYERSETKPSIELMEKQEEPADKTEKSRGNSNILSVAAFSVVGLIAAIVLIFIIKRNGK